MLLWMPSYVLGAPTQRGELLGRTYLHNIFNSLHCKKKLGVWLTSPCFWCLALTLPTLHPMPRCPGTYHPDITTWHPQANTRPTALEEPTDDASEAHSILRAHDIFPNTQCPKGEHYSPHWFPRSTVSGSVTASPAFASLHLQYHLVVVFLLLLCFFCYCYHYRIVWWGNNQGWKRVH